MSWRIKQFLNKWTPIALVAAALFVGYTHWQRGGRGTVGSVLTSVGVAARRLPVLGTYFGRSHYSYSPYRSHRQYAYGRRHRRHHGHGRRHRRGRRRY